MGKEKLVFLAIIALLAVQIAAAENFVDAISNNPALEGITGERFAEFYDRFWWIVDLTVYTLILGYAIKLGLSRSQFGTQGNAMGMVIAVILAIAAVIFEQQTGFRLGNLGPLAFAVVIFFIAFGLWRAIGGLGLGSGSRTVLAIMFLVIYGLLGKFLQPLREMGGWIGTVVSIIDIMVIVMFVLAVIGAISFFKGMGGGGGGAAKNSLIRDETRELGGENILGKEEEFQKSEEKREFADLSAIQGLSKREMNDVNRIISDIDRIIKVLKKGRLNAEAVQEIRQKVGEIMPSAADIKNSELALRARIADLDRTETQELANIDNQLKIARQETVNELAALRKSQQLGEQTPLLSVKPKLDAQRRLVEDTKRRAFAQLSKTRKQLETRAIEVSQLEAQFSQQYNSAMAYLAQPNGVQPAIGSLEAAKATLRKIGKELNQLGKADVGKIWGELGRKIRDSNLESKLRGGISKGVKQSIISTKTGRARRGISFSFRGFGRIRR